MRYFEKVDEAGVVLREVDEETLFSYSGNEPAYRLAVVDGVVALRPTPIPTPLPNPLLEVYVAKLNAKYPSLELSADDTIEEAKTKLYAVEAEVEEVANLLVLSREGAGL